MDLKQAERDYNLMQDQMHALESNYKREIDDKQWI